MATRSTILARIIPWTEDPGGLQCMGGKESDMTEHKHRTFIYVFWPCCMACGISVPQLGIKPTSPQWKHRVLGRDCQGSPLATMFHVFSFSKKLPTPPGNHHAGNSSRQRKLHEASLRSLIPTVAMIAPSLFRKILGLRILAPITLLMLALRP